MLPCVLRPGERALVTREGVLFPDGTLVPSATVCDYQPGSTLFFRFGDGSEVPYLGPPYAPLPAHEVVVDPSASPETPSLSTEPAAPAPAAVAPAAPAPAAPGAQTLVGGDSDLGLALGAGQILQDNPWAPLVMLALAGVGVLGGRKAWSFYSERAAQNHEIALKKLDIEEKQAKHQQPPACLLRDAEHEAKLSTMQQQLTALESKVAGMERTAIGDFDLETLQGIEKRLKKVERSIKADKDND